MANLPWKNNADSIQKATIQYGRPVKAVKHGSIVNLSSGLMATAKVGLQINENKPPVMVVDSDVDIRIGDTVIVSG